MAGYSFQKFKTCFQKKPLHSADCLTKLFADCAFNVSCLQINTQLSAPHRHFFLPARFLFKKEIELKLFKDYGQAVTEYGVCWLFPFNVQFSQCRTVKLNMVWNNKFVVVPRALLKLALLRIWRFCCLSNQTVCDKTSTHCFEYMHCDFNVTLSTFWCLISNQSICLLSIKQIFSIMCRFYSLGC